MKKSNWIGTAVSLALCTAALTACSNSGNSSNQPVANASAPNGSPEVQWNSKLAGQIREIIANAPRNGLKPSLFLKGNEQGSQLTDAALRYAEALAHGFVDPTKISQVYTVPRPSDDIKQGFMDAVQKNDLVNWFNSLPPQTDEYKALSLAHIKYLKLAAKTNFQPIADGKPINPNSRDDRVPQLEAALLAMGYLGQSPSAAGQQTLDPAAASTNAAAPSKAPASDNVSGPPGPNSSNRYRPALVKAVKAIQSDFGLKVDGIVGGNTLAAINLGPAGLARTCAIAMERLRWLERNPPQTRIDVNTAATILDYWRDGQHLDRRNVVAGEPDKQTPQIEAPITTLVAYPKWRVPDSISSDELSKKSPDWLKQNQFSIENGKYVQESGPKNSLGIVKFDMDDNQAIYLHDTPAKALFSLPDRHRSHGCVRVDNAVAFANAIATEEGVADQFQQAMAAKQEKYIKLKDPIPVRLLYHTAFWDGSRIVFRPDVYGWDNVVAAALGLVRGVTWQKVQQSGDVGP